MTTHPAPIIPTFVVDHDAAPAEGLTALLARLLVDLDRNLLAEEAAIVDIACREHGPAAVVREP